MKRRFWVAYKHSCRGEYYASVDGLRWVRIPSLFTDSDRSKVQQMCDLAEYTEEGHFIHLSDLCSRNFKVVSPR